MKFLFISLFSVFFFLLGNTLFAQTAADEVVRETLMISIKKHSESNSKYQHLANEEARNFDIEKYILENIQDSDIRISGQKISFGKTVKINFDSKKIDLQNDCNQICKSIVSISKVPVLGMTVSPIDDLQGVLVETVYEDSAAEQAGIQQGDMITFVADSIIQSTCDLLEVVGDSEVGEVMDIFVVDGGKKEILPLILGYKIQENITYEYCCNSDLVEEIVVGSKQNNLFIFPNPTDGVTQLKFRSTEKTDLKISLTDVAGHQILKSEIKDFDGYYNEVLDLTDYAAGLYFVQVVQGQHVWTEKIVLQNL